MITNDNCCKDCQDRVVGCHSKCKKYQTWLEDYHKEKKMIRKREQMYRDYFYR